MKLIMMVKQVLLEKLYSLMDSVLTVQLSDTSKLSGWVNVKNAPKLSEELFSTMCR